MDQDDLEELATKLHGKGSHWDLFQIAAGTGLVLYVALAGSLALGIRKALVQVPFVPSSAKQVSNMMSLLKGRSGKLVDLGSGDGRIVRVAELLEHGIPKADLSDCNNLTVFLAPSVVPSLERKLLSELPDEACVVAARFPFLTWTPARDAGESLERAWAYNIKDIRQAKQDTARGGPAKEKLSVRYSDFLNTDSDSEFGSDDSLSGLMESMKIRMANSPPKMTCNDDTSSSTIKSQESQTQRKPCLQKRQPSPPSQKMLPSPIQGRK
ncbi:hypothetical protein JD844_019592 [Phrynosoma platyrhinos]|uniref:Uncharacterized protein n=1 Tax=Phrynosoma platyrhinos TaxID=52577 RepID=A0ABQ7TPR3_PHRPL|nr:hypothetical protein JD844_019592 [Phrynosoma platyrhinos]